MSWLRAAHNEGDLDCGLIMTNGTIGDVRVLGITESFKVCVLRPLPPLLRALTLPFFESSQVKQQVLLSATEAATMLLRVDNILRSAPRQVIHPSSPSLSPTLSPNAKTTKKQRTG